MAALTSERAEKAVTDDLGAKSANSPVLWKNAQSYKR